jgi:hypothetical protein
MSPLEESSEAQDEGDDYSCNGLTLTDGNEEEEARRALMKVDELLIVGWYSSAMTIAPMPMPLFQGNCIRADIDADDGLESDPGSGSYGALDWQRRDGRERYCIWAEETHAKTLSKFHHPV